MDYIQNLLSQTGWSCEDLMKKLAEFKEKSKLNPDTEIKPNEKKKEEEEGEKKTNNLDKNKNLPNGTERKLSQELSDHTYTLNVKHKNKIDKKPFSPRNLHLKSLSISRTNSTNYLLKSRRVRWRHLRWRKIDRKVLIAQYKRPEVVRSQIIEQLQLLRSRKLNVPVGTKQSITENKIVSKKRYVGEKCSDLLNEFIEVADENLVIESDENLVIESNDILEDHCNVIIENDFEIFESPLCQSTTNFSKPNESIAETIKNRISTNAEKEEVPGTSKDGLEPTEFSMISNECSMDISDVSVGEESVETSIKDIMIVDVRGGCEEIPENESNEPGDHNHMIKPTKTKDITKIKGWKNKKFDVDKSLNAAFASSNLDGFLEAANLQISFKIPKLESGNEPLNQAPKVFTPKISPKENESDQLNLYRPRTLGQKKRIMKLKYDLKTKKNIQKPRTLAEKRRLLGNDIEKIKITLPVTETIPVNYSYVLHRGKKLRVVTKTATNQIIAYIKSINLKPNYMYVPKKPRVTKDKPSIFKNTYSPTAPVLRYRPGPLCRKANLQYNNENWKTTLKKLPRATLTVVPEYKKPIHPYITGLLPEYGFEITPDRLEFALSALESNKKEVTCFEFRVPYQNKQEEILLREKLFVTKPPEVEIKQDELSIDETCRDIVDKMLNYLEIKEISDDVIKNDVNAKFLTEEKIVEQKEEPGRRSKKRPRQANKTNYELKRLNVKVIEVNLEEKEEIKNCNKDFCRLGCICRSLSTTSSLVSNHCGRVDCMFECSCNYERKSKGNVKVTFPIGTDLLSEGAVNRLEDAAKRNLAKVEKEFTQTVIQANNQTIVVGGCTNRQRRVTKLPKKYTDYIDNFDFIPANLLRQTETDFEKYKDDVRPCQVVDCRINLTKLELSEIIPFCLVHNLYDCHCGYEAEYIPKEPPLKSEINPSEIKLETNTSDVNSGDNELPDARLLELLEEELIPYTADARSLKQKPKSPFGTGEMECARTKGIPTAYYIVRNRTNKFITMRNRKFVRNMNRGGFNHDMRLDVDLKPINNSAGSDDASKDDVDDIITVTHEKSRRKQELVARIDGDMCTIVSPERKIPKRTERFVKKPMGKSTERTLEKDNSNNNTESDKLGETPKSSEVKPISMPLLKFRKIFPLAQENVHYFQPSPEITGQFVSMLGKNSKKPNTTFCLLQWQTLATNYRLGKVNVWFSSYFNFPKIVITDLTIVPKYFTNIKNFESTANRSLQKNEIVKALITDSIPSVNPKDEVQVILELTDMLCHVHGTIKKNQGKQENVLLPENKNSKVIQTQSLFEKNEVNEAEKKPPLPYPTVRKIMFSKLRCLQYNYFTVDKDNENVLPCSVTASLPTIKNTALWRMIKLNSDFSVLSLENTDYRIKYSDLQKVLNMAEDKNMTIAIKTGLEPSGRTHKDFGIYASPKCPSAVFVGPYHRTEDHDIILMRYLNRELVPTKLFNKMKGLPSANIGVWIEQSNDSLDTDNSCHTIDLTLSDQEEAANRDDDKLLLTHNDLEKYEDECENYFAIQTGYLELENTKLIPFFQSSVYFSTNVTALGYIIGHQLGGDAVVVRYPTFNTVLQFKNHALAVQYLEREFKSSFIEAPGFSIKIIIKSKEDNSGIVFNPEFLKGYYIVSDTGLTNILELTNAKLKALYMTLPDLENAIKLRAARLIYDQCLEAAKTCLNQLMPRQRNCTKALLHTLRVEAERLTSDLQQHKLQKNIVLRQKSILLDHFKEVFIHLAPCVNPKLKHKMQEVLKRHGKLVEVEDTPKVSLETTSPDKDTKKDTNESSITNLKVDPSLPIYTKNPDMIITATISPCKENVDNRIPKVLHKDGNDLKENEEVVLNPANIDRKDLKFSDKLNIYKYLWKTASGKIIEIGPEQYEMFRAQHNKTKPSSSMKAFQIGPVTITPKLSKVELDPIMAKLPTAELKNISVPDNLPPGFVKLTLKNLSQLSSTQNNTTDINR